MGFGEIMPSTISKPYAKTNPIRELAHIMLRHDFKGAKLIFLF
jgi:hypothetical protein